MRCECWHPFDNIFGGICYGTKECEPCDCNADTNKCNFYFHVREKDEKLKCLDVPNVVTTCSGEHLQSLEPATTGSAANAEIGSKTTLPTKQKERTPMKDKRFVLNLHLEQNEELMAEIDSLIRERVKMIIREEAEKLIGGTVEEEAQRVVSNKLENMKKYELENAIAVGVKKYLVWEDHIDNAFNKAITSYLNDRSYTTNCMIRDYVNSKLSGIINADVIKAVADALTKR